MTTESESVLWTLQDLLDLFDVASEGSGPISAPTGLAGADDRQVVEGTQVLVSPVAADLLNETFGTDAVTPELLVGIAKITVNTTSGDDGN